MQLPNNLWQLFFVLYLPDMRQFVFFFLILGSTFLSAQIVLTPDGRTTPAEQDRMANDSLLDRSGSLKPSDSLKIYNPVIGDYNFWTDRLSKRQVDTVMTIDSFYRQNVYQQDLFSFQQFPNWGQTLNPLVPVSPDDNLQLLPTGKSWMYTKENEVRYFDVKTPLTEIILENGSKEGQFLSTTFAHNIHSRFNYSIGYKYLKSQGNYLNSLANHSNIILSSNYRTENNRYSIQGNFVTHDFNNQENNGLTAESLEAFTENDPNFSNRERMYVNTYYGQSVYDERRVHLDHKFGIFSFGSKAENDSLSKDSLVSERNYPLYFRHTFNYKHQAFQYEERNPDQYFQSELVGERRYNRKKFNKLENRLALGYQWSDRLFIEGGVLHQILKLYNDEEYILADLTIPESTEENRFGLHGRMQFDWRENIDINAEASFTRGDFFGNQYSLNAEIRLIPFKNYLMTGGVRLNSSFPSLNLFMNRSFYEDFNYYNSGFENQTTQELYAEIGSELLGLSIFGSAYNQTNMVYVDADYLPKQADGAVNWFRLGAREEFSYKKFGFDVQAQFQKVIENSEFLPLPSVITRATAFYETRAFKDHAHIMTGLTGHYYTGFESREFFPILNEFMLSQPQNSRTIGGYPQIDAFFNLKVDRMRIYIRGLNLNSFIQPGKYFATPLQPARDFKIQFGIHWFLFS